MQTNTWDSQLDPHLGHPSMPQALDQATAVEADVEELASARICAGRHHARYVDPDVPLHVISRVFQGRHLLTPSPELNALVIGVLGHALELYGSIRLYAVAVLSNHAHFMLSGQPDQVSAFMGFVKREISRRWGSRSDVNWPGAMWEESLLTALPTAASHERCLAYILSQGVKENLVERPQDWPGVHCAHTLLTGEPLRGTWLNTTAFGRALRAEQRKLTCNRVYIDKRAYEDEHEVRLTPLPHWEELNSAERRARVAQLVDRITETARQARGEVPVLGVLGVLRTPPELRTTLPKPPWFEERRRMICWANPWAPETRAYLGRYWQFQREFRAASNALLAGEVGVRFPPGAFRPLTYTPLRRAA